MQVKVAVAGADGRGIAQIADIQKDEELSAAVMKALAEYRSTYPDEPAYGHEIKIGPA